MKKVVTLIALFISIPAFAQKKAAPKKPQHVQSVCEDQDYKDSKKFKCWWGSEFGDSISVDNGVIWIGLRDVQGFSVGEYDEQHTHIFYGLGGDDEIIGGDQTDIILGGNGHDMLRGAKGDDFMYGDNGADTLYGEQGNDHLIGGPDNQNDYLNGGAGNDYLDGGKGQNGSFGGPGNDTIKANADDITILPDDEDNLGYSDEVVIYGAKNMSQVTSKRYAFDKKDTISFQEIRP